MNIDPDRSRVNEKMWRLRNKMIISGIKKGFSHPETIKLSQELDKLIYVCQSSSAV